MLHIRKPPLEPVIIMCMPIPEQVLKPEPQRNDLGHDVSKYKSDPSHFRLAWLHNLERPSGKHIINWCIYALAIVGLLSIFF